MLMDDPSHTQSLPNYLNAGGHRLEYVWHGPAAADAPTIIFLHEGLGCVQMWRDFPARVAHATGFGALVYSRAGYGQSDPVSLPRAVSFMHEEALVVLPEIIRQLGIREAILFGHSDGGSISLIYAGSNPATTIRGLILEAPHVFVEDISIKSISEALVNYETGALRSGLERYHGKNVACAFLGWNQVWLNPEFRSWNIEEYLPQIKVPVLLIQGLEDQYGTLRQVEAIADGCAGYVSRIILPNCGHSPHKDQPERTLEAVKSFVRSNAVA